MSKSAENKIVGIRFQPFGKLYHFNARNTPDLKTGDFVMVSTNRGRELGQLVHFIEDPPDPPDGSWKLIERRATPQELVMRRLWLRKELEATIECRAFAAEIGLKGIKVPRVEFSYDGSRLTVLYHVEGDEKIDLSELKRRLRRAHRQTRLEFRQIGPRDVAKITGGMGACGLEDRCCSRFLNEFSPISIRMAKAQGISLNPQEITGLCGRLRCCLIYEYEQYVEARKQLPKRKKIVSTPRGEGKVVDLFPLKGSVIVQMEDGRKVEVLKDEIEPSEELKALKKKANSPCDEHNNGGRGRQES
jgi:cell fate regulator YaaT (PSP1 superfamily)